MGCSFWQHAFFLLLLPQFSLGVQVTEDRGEPSGPAELQPLVAEQSPQLLERPLCIAGQAVPRIYLLGHAKCGTTTVAKDLHRAGARFFTFAGVPLLGDAPVGKESHLFDSICGFRANEFYTDQIAGCLPAAEGVRERWLRGIHNMSCASPQATILDATPSNARLPGLPALMAKLYAGAGARRLGFLLLLREPLARLQSQWYHVRQEAESHARPPPPAEFGRSFGDYLNTMEPKVAWYKARAYRGMAVDMSVDFVYRSLYDLSLRSWLESFDGGQFLVVPIEAYRGSGLLRTEVLRALGQRFGATLSGRESGGQLPHHNEGLHPTLLRDVDNATVERWYGSFFLPDLDSLAATLASTEGLHLVGCAARSNATEVSEYLCRTLPCLV